MFQYGNHYKRYGLGTLYSADEKKTQTECPKLAPGADIFPAEFQLLGPFWRVSIWSLDQTFLILIF